MKTPRQIVDELIPSKSEQARIMAMSDEEAKAICPAWDEFLDAALAPTPLAAIAR